MARYVDIELVMKNIQQLRGCTCSYSDGIIDDVEMMMDMAPDADVIPISEGATNGDMIKAMFPSTKIRWISQSHIGITFRDNQEYITEFELDWWNAPYKADKE